MRPDLDLLRTSRPVAETASTITFAVGTPLEEIERRMLFKTLAFFDNNKARTAEALGVTTKTIYNRLAHYQSQARDKEPDQDGDGTPTDESRASGPVPLSPARARASRRLHARCARLR